MKTKHVFLLAFCVLLASCGSADAPKAELSILPAAPAPEISLAAYHAGKDLYMTHCFFCHGKEADGNGSLASSMEGPKPRDFTLSALSAVHPDSLKRVILEGGEAVGLSSNMPAWAGTISPTEAEFLVAFVQMVSKEGGLLPEAEESLKLTDIPQESQPTY